MRELAKKTGKVAFNELVKIGKEEFMKDTDRKQEDLNKRMDNFSRNLNEELKKTPHYTKKKGTYRTKKRLKTNKD